MVERQSDTRPLQFSLDVLRSILMALLGHSLVRRYVRSFYTGLENLRFVPLAERGERPAQRLAA
jgi:hypothetical protein